jgi:hypothetical protein
MPETLPKHVQRKILESWSPNCVRSDTPALMALSSRSSNEPISRAETAHIEEDKRSRPEQRRHGAGVVAIRLG